MKYIILALALTAILFGHEIIQDAWQIEIVDWSLTNGYTAIVMPGESSEFQFAGGNYNVVIDSARWTTDQLIVMLYPDIEDWIPGVFESDSLWAWQEEAETGDGLTLAWETRVRCEGDFSIFSQLMIVENEGDSTIHFTPNTIIDLGGCDDLPFYLYSSTACTLGADDFGPFYLTEPLDSAIFKVYQAGEIYPIYTTIYPANPEYVLFANWREILGQFGGYDTLASGSTDDLALAIQWNEILIEAGATDTVGMEFAVIDSGASITERDLPESHDLNIFPNPFNSSVRIAVEAYCNTSLQIRIYDIHGCLVDELRPGANVWQPDESVTSGIYLIKANLGDYSITRRAVYLR